MTGCLFAPFRWLAKGVAAYITGYFKMACLAVTLLVGFGFLILCRVPLVAYALHVDQFDLILRLLDYHQAEPLYLVPGYQGVVERVRIPFKTHLTGGRVETLQLGPNQYQHKVWVKDDKNRDKLEETLTSTTPHTVIPVAELAEARAAMEYLYPSRDPETRQQLLQWGQGLFALWREKVFIGPNLRMTQNPPTEEETLWFAWKRLHSGNAALDKDLFNLGWLVRSAFPEPSDYQAALAWAQTWYDRQDKYFKEYRKRLEAQRAGNIEAQIGRVLPPPTDTTWAWMLYQFVGLNEPSKQEAQKRWLSVFGGPHRQRVLRWGWELDRERRAAGETLPPPGDTVALVCVIERLSGTDRYGEKCRQALYDILGKQVLWWQVDEPLWRNAMGELVLQWAIQLTYPNDDLFYVMAAGDPLQLMSGFGGYVPEVVFMVVLAPLVLYGLRVLIFQVLARGFLFLKKNPRFLEYEQAQNPFSWRHVLLGFTLTPLVTWLYTMNANTLAPQVQLMIGSPLQLLAGVYITVVLGGMVLLCVNRLFAVLLIRLGMDVHETWLDEILGTAAGAALMYLFGNDFSSIAAFTAFAVIPESLRRLTQKRKPEAASSAVQESTPAPLPVLRPTPEPARASCLTWLLIVIVVLAMIAAAGYVFVWPLVKGKL